MCFLAEVARFLARVTDSRLWQDKKSLAILQGASVPQDQSLTVFVLYFKLIFEPFGEIGKSANNHKLCQKSAGVFNNIGTIQYSPIRQYMPNSPIDIIRPVYAEFADICHYRYMPVYADIRRYLPNSPSLCRI